MAKRPPKGVVNQNIMQFIQHHEEVTAEQIAEYLGFQISIVKPLITDLINKGYIGININKYYSNFLYN